MFVEIPEKLEPLVNYDWIDLKQGKAILAEERTEDSQSEAR